MDVTQDVIVDLLPVYFSGEASPSTRALVDEFLQRDPALAERVKREWTDPIVPRAALAVNADVQLRSLQRTKRLLIAQRWLFGIAMTCTALPLSLEMTFTHGRLTEWHFLARDYPGALLPFLAAGVAGWIAYTVLGSRLRVSKKS